jgi:hypothetical protein
MDSGTLFASFFFGLVGTGMLTYGYKMGRAVPMCAGGAVMLATYFIPNMVMMIVVCCALAALPWIIREA